MKTILLHGLGQTAAAWNNIVKLSALTDVDCPELFSLSHSEPTYDAILRGLERRLAGASEPFRLCGLSLGAMLALDYSLRHPENTASLVLMGGQYKAPTRLIDLQNLLFRWMPEGAFRDWGLSKQDAIRLCRSMRSLDLSGRLHELTCPVTVLCGQRDRANLRAAREMHQAIPRSALRILPGAGHALDQEAPEAVAALLREEGTAGAVERP